MLPVYEQKGKSAMKRFTHLLIVVCLSVVIVAAMVLQSSACFTVLVGKDASETGRVMVTHNEDDGGRAMVDHGYVPPKDWPAGSVLPAEEGRAAIPQVSHTLGYYWSQLKPASGGYSNADAFYNDAGVLIVSNSNASSKVDTSDESRVTDGGIEYNLRRVLAERAKACAPNATLITIGNFLADPHLDNLFATLTSVAGEDVESAAPAAAGPAPVGSAMNGVLRREGVKLGQTAADKYEAIRAAGRLLAQLGYVDESYTEAMVGRENLVTTYMGMGVAIPHGTSQKKGTVKKSGVVLLQYPQGVDFGDEKAYLVFGIAGVGDEHLDLLANVCNLLEDEDALEQLKTTADLDFVMEKLQA